MIEKLSKKGFTLIELLIVIAIIAILAAIVIIAINPAKQLADARNSQRWSDVNSVLNAVHQYAIDNNGNLPTDNDDDDMATCPATSDASDFSDKLVSTYIVAVPTDPSDASDYTVCQSANGRVTVAAPEAEEGESISVQR